MGRGQLPAPRISSTAQGSKVGKEFPKVGNRRAGTDDMERAGWWGASAEGKHAPPAMIHGVHCRQTHHIPHSAVHSRRGPCQPDGRLGEWGRQEASRCQCLTDGVDHAPGYRAGPVVVVAVRWGPSATETGPLLPLLPHPGRGGVGIVHQPPEGLLALVFPADSPQAFKQRPELIQWAYRGVKR